ncbi:hypothetical protein IEU95_14505 [Hoyosella rhizosphaerae]|uniref:Uncharacterized protein n=1 Tax=Hoyosella rhizosphaerae TaxID=1755582 RepID=A0A916XGK5_9ACTN|nr:hypothetical protein [Hoyosella rhizosphaerae]MBN4928049.1 hypothetical protein [Hoyosella rhizosphaerae]GGC71982.1 hypothetical protein GCM10011410_26280 [Hoyosella rhizosphaerae]
MAPASRRDFEADIESGSLDVGSPEKVARKIAKTVNTLDLSLFDLKYSLASMPHEMLLNTIGVYGTEVIPRVRELLDRG